MSNKTLNLTLTIIIHGHSVFVYAGTTGRSIVLDKMYNAVFTDASFEMHEKERVFSQRAPEMTRTGPV